MEKGLIPIPDYISQINPPSLWAYYSTLPKFAREDPVVRNVVMAMEYHKPTMTIRQKEDALNYACSLLRPIEPTLQKVLAEAHSTEKIKLNVKLGQ